VATTPRMPIAAESAARSTVPVICLDDAVSALALLRFVSALELDQVRATWAPLTELELAACNLEIGVACSISPWSSAPRAAILSSSSRTGSEALGQSRRQRPSS
jgi:hypothetical protein